MNAITFRTELSLDYSTIICHILLGYSVVKEIKAKIIVSLSKTLNETKKNIKKSIFNLYLILSLRSQELKIL
jgi:hypothetical protein